MTMTAYLVITSLIFALSSWIGLRAAHELGGWSRDAIVHWITTLIFVALYTWSMWLLLTRVSII